MGDLATFRQALLRGAGVYLAALTLERCAVWTGSGVAALETRLEQCVERRRAAIDFDLAPSARLASGFGSGIVAHAACKCRSVSSKLPSVGQN